MVRRLLGSRREVPMNPAAHVAGVEEVAIRQGDLYLVPCSLKAAFE